MMQQVLAGVKVIDVTLGRSAVAAGLDGPYPLLTR